MVSVAGALTLVVGLLGAAIFALLPTQVRIGNVR